MLGECEAKNGTKANKLLHAGTDGHQRIWRHGEKTPNTRGRESPSQRSKVLRIEGEKNRITRKECRRLLNNFEIEGLMAKKGLWKLAKEKNNGKRRVAK